jgi:copper homeostasis protein
MKLEVIGFNIESCVAAQEGGAHRIELCAGPGEGGTTPSYGFIKAAREILHIALYVMIRPRGGDFLYTEKEFAIMQEDIRICKQLGCDGIVTGMLTSEGKVDEEKCNQLVRLAYPMEATFHRAFDRTANAEEALEQIIDLGFERVLTSGQKPKSIEATERLANLVKQSDGRIIIMPGSGVNSKNIIAIAESTGVTELHSSAGISQTSKMQFQNPDMNESLEHITVDKEEVKTMIRLLNEFKKVKLQN